MLSKEELYICLKRIEEDEGILTPESVVNHAKNVSSPLHSRFDWNDSSAATQWRLQQARSLIREVTVDWQGKETREFFSVVTHHEGKEERGYVSLDKVLSNTDLHKQVVKDALSELKYWQQKYKTLAEFKGVIFEDKIKEIEESL